MTITPDSASTAQLESAAPPRWHTSSYSGGGGGACVQVARRSESLAVRDSKNPAGGMLAFAPGAWSSFVDALRAGDLPAG